MSTAKLQNIAGSKKIFTTMHFANNSFEQGNAFIGKEYGLFFYPKTKYQTFETKYAIQVKYSRTLKKLSEG